MNKSIAAIAGLGMISLAVGAQAQVQRETTTVRNGVAKTTEVIKSGKRLETISCSAFNALDESFKPQAVAYAVDYTKKGKPVDPMIDVAGTERVTPVIITDCKAHPDRSLIDRVRAAFHRKHK